MPGWWLLLNIRRRAGVGSAFCAAFAHMTIKQATYSERVGTIVFYFFWVSTVLSAPSAIYGDDSAKGEDAGGVASAGTEWSIAPRVHSFSEALVLPSL